MAAGPAIGSSLAINFGMNTMFMTSSFVGFLSMACIFAMKESVRNTSKFHVKMLVVNKDEILEKRVFPSSFVMLLTTYSFGMALTIIPDFSDFLDVKNRGLFFSVMLVMSILTRLISGRASDKYGRIKLLLIGAVSLVAATAILALTTNQTMFFVGGVIFGIATGINSPTLFAWTVDLADPIKRGKAIATMFIALEVGILSGALISAEFYDNNPNFFPLAFSSGAVLAAIAFGYLLIYNKYLKNSH